MGKAKRIKKAGTRESKPGKASSHGHVRRKAAGELEQRVQERTTELTETVQRLQDEGPAHVGRGETLNERSRLLEAFFRHSVTPLVILDRNFNFIRVNETYAKACRKDESEFPGHNHFEFYPHAENQAIFENVVRTKKPYQAFAKPFSFPDHPEWGLTYWNWTLTPLLDGAGQVEFLVFALEDVTERKRAEDQLRALNEALERRTAQLRQLASELTLTEQRERRRLALILHDHLQQLLVGAKMRVEMLESRLQQSDMPEHIRQVAEILGESIEASRSLTAELSPPILYEAGLAAALEWLGRQMQDKHGLAVEIEANPDTPIDPHDQSISVLLFQSVRELLFNIVKHARAKSAQVRLSWLDGEMIQIVVADQGVGFDLARLGAEGASGGFGLFSIRERLQMMGGRLKVDTAAGRGTRVTLVAPIHAATRLS